MSREAVEGRFSFLKPCDCFTQASEDTSSVFARRVPNSSVTEEAFKDYVDENRVVLKNDCDWKCKRHALSVDLYSEESSETVMDNYRIAKEHNPSLQNYVAIFKVKQGAGLFKPTPNLKKNPYHYTFFKSRNDILDYIEVIEAITL